MKSTDLQRSVIELHGELVEVTRYPEKRAKKGSKMTTSNRKHKAPPPSADWLKQQGFIK